MYKNNKYGFSLVNGPQREKGFSLVELIVVIAIIGILVMLASPRFLGRTKEATLAKHLYNVKTLGDTMDKYRLDNKDKFPRLSEEAYTSEEVEEYANKIRDITGKEVTLDPKGKYYDIDYIALRNYVKVPNKRDKPNYILQNPVGKVFFLEEFTEIASDRADFTVRNIKNKGVFEEIKGPNGETIPEGYILAADEDFSGTRDDTFRYIGPHEYVAIPHIIKGVPVTSYNLMFNNTPVKGVASNNTNITTMYEMFKNSRADSLELSAFETSNVTNMGGMFDGSKATNLNLSSFSTSKVTSMTSMFSRNQATNLNLSSFDTSNVTRMNTMFQRSKATILDLSSFDTSKVTDMKDMFYENESVEIDLSSFNTSNVINMSSMFRYNKATKLDLSSFDTSNVNLMSYMFNGSYATTLDLSSFNTSRVYSMSNMFEDSKATNINLSSFNTSNVNDMSAMFSSNELTSLDLSSFNTINVQNMQRMFSSCKIDILDLSSFNTRSVRSVAQMFQNSKSTIVYLRTYDEWSKFRESSFMPHTLRFVVNQ